MAETFLSREEWALAQGKKVTEMALRLRRSRRSRSSARSSHQRGEVFARVLNNIERRRDCGRSYDTRSRFV